MSLSVPVLVAFSCLMIDDVVTLESTTPLLFSPLVFRDLYDGNASCVCLIGLFQSTSGAVLVCPRVMSSLSIKGERESVDWSFRPFLSRLSSAKQEQSVMDGSREKERSNS